MPEDAEIQPSDARAMMRPREQIAPVAPFITPPLVAPRSRSRRSRHRHSQPFTPPPPLAPPPLTLRSRRCRACRLDSERWWGEEEKQQEQKQQQERDGGSRGRTSTKSSRQYGEEEG